LLGATVLIAAVAFGANALDEALFGRPAASSWTPFVAGLGLGALPCLAWIAVTSADGSASWRVGAQAEQWTARELDALGPSWIIEHDIPFPERTYTANVDHVAVGPHGVLAVETKWTSHEVDLRARRLAPEVERAVRQAQASAGRISGLIRRVNDQVAVIPVVVYWGPHVIPPPEPVRRHDGVRVLAGRQGAEWRCRLGDTRLAAADIDRIAARVRDWRIEQEARTVGIAIAARLRQAHRLGRLSVGLALLMVALVPLSRVSGSAGDFVDTMFRIGGRPLALALLLAPLITGLGSATLVGLARQNDPELRSVPGFVPLGVWIVGFVGLIVAM
jgi:hypothetical protein